MSNVRNDEVCRPKDRIFLPSDTVLQRYGDAAEATVGVVSEYDPISVSSAGLFVLCSGSAPSS